MSILDTNMRKRKRDDRNDEDKRIPKSTKSRRLMKIQDPEKYEAYLKEQRERNKIRRKERKVLNDL